MQQLILNAEKQSDATFDQDWLRDLKMFRPCCRIPPILSHVFNLCLPSSVIIYILQPRAAVKYHCLLTNQPTTGIDC
jgi:hypothetical protein